MEKRAVGIAKLRIDQVRMDGGTQSRVELSAETIDEYAETYARKDADMPAIVVFYDGTAHWLADGFHRVHGARKAGRHKIDADVRQGSQRDAVLYSVGANAKHGLRRTNADKRRAVEMVLRLLEGEGKSETDRWIAVKCAVSHQAVANYRAQLSTLDTSRVRVGRDGKSYQATKTKRAAPKPTPEPESNASTGDPETDEAIAWQLKKQRSERGGGVEPRGVDLRRLTQRDNIVPLRADSERDADQRFDADAKCSELLRYIQALVDEWPAEESIEPLATVLYCELEFVQIRENERRKKAQ